MEVPATKLSIAYLHYDYDVLELLHRPTPQDAAREALELPDEAVVAKRAPDALGPPQPLEQFRLRSLLE